MREIRLPIRQLAEFLCRSGSLDSRGGGFDRARKGARLHRRLQKQGGEGYAGEDALFALAALIAGVAHAVTTSNLMPARKATSRTEPNSAWER